MIALSVFPDGEGIGERWEPIKGKEVIELHGPTAVAALAGGMASGKPSVGLLLPLPDGRYALAQTSLALFLAAADVLKAAHGDPRT